MGDGPHVLNVEKGIDVGRKSWRQAIKILQHCRTCTHCGNDHAEQHPDKITPLFADLFIQLVAAIVESADILYDDMQVIFGGMVLLAPGFALIVVTGELPSPLRRCGNSREIRGMMVVIWVLR